MTVAEVAMWFDVWAGDDLLGTAIGTLTEGSDRQIRKVDNDIGQGSFTINRNATQFASLCATDNLVRVRLEDGGPFDYDDERYVFAWFIEEGEDTILSTDEDGGEIVRLAGRDAVVILSRAVIDYVAHHPFNIEPVTGHASFAASAATDGQWHIYGSDFISDAVGTPGSVLRIFLRDADSQTPEPISEVTHDFNVTTDSIGTTWAEGQTDWAFDVGTDLITVLFILVNGGLWYTFHPSLLLQAFEDRPGTDLSGSITISAGTNVREAGTRQIHAKTVKSRVLVRGSNKAGGYSYHWATDTGIEASEVGVRQGFLDYQASGTASRLERAGQTTIRTAKNQHDGPPTTGVLNEVGQVALVDYQPGDTVAVSIPEFSGDYRIHAITLVENDAGYVDPILEFVEEAFTDLPGLSAATSAAVLADPFFVYDAASSASPLLAIRFRTVGGDHYQIIGSAEGDADNDAYILIEQNALLLNLNDFPGSSFAAVELTPNGVFVEGKQVVIESTGSADNSKVYLDSNKGVVIADLTSDPGSGASQEGQIYWNSSSNVFRVYDGTTWADLLTSLTSPPDVHVVATAEANTPGTTSASSNTPTDIPFDTFYDVDSGTIADLSTLDLTYSAGVFTAAADGAWILWLGVVLTTTPGTTGSVTLVTPDFGASPSIDVAASGNKDWLTERTVVMRSGQTFSLSQRAIGSSQTIVDYVSIQITRLASAIA